MKYIYESKILLKHTLNDKEKKKRIFAEVKYRYK